MKELSKKEMQKVYGGAISASWISAMFRGVTSVTDLGRYLGSSIRRFVDRNLCGY